MSFLKFVGVTKYWYRTVPLALTVYSRGILKIASGFSMTQPSPYSFFGGRSHVSPIGMPLSIQPTSVSISFWVNLMLLLKCPYRGSACQGGIRRWTTASLIVLDQFLARS